MSAVYRLMPSPPARVDSRKMNFSLPSALKPSIWLSRSSPLVLPAPRPKTHALSDCSSWHTLTNPMQLLHPLTIPVVL